MLLWINFKNYSHYAVILHLVTVHYFYSCNKVSSIHLHKSNSVYTTQFMTSVYFNTVAKYNKTFIF